MTLDDAKKFVDLFVDDELPMELATEFKQAMFENSELRDEVASLRQTKEAVTEAFASDGISPVEDARVRARIFGELGLLEPIRSVNTRQPILPMAYDRSYLIVKSTEV